MKNRNVVLWALGSVLAVSIASPGIANAQVSVSNVYTDEAVPVRVDGSSTLVRTSTNVAMTINMRGLTPGNAYTNWWINFNNPDQCVTPCACGLDDFGPPFNDNADIGVSWADGRVADSHGQAQFAASATYGVLPDFNGDNQPIPTAIKEGAEIHLIVRSHGKARGKSAKLEDQLTMLEGGIGVDTHFAVHPSPSCP